MKCEELTSQMIEALDISQVNFRPIIRAYMQRLGLVELINELVVTKMDVEPEIIVEVMPE